ncbi:MAG: helix-turn-helix transcriptional regulator, partial [Bacilli bacterium]
MNGETPTPKTKTPPLPIPPGTAMKQLSEKQGMNQKELSVRLGITEKHVVDVLKSRVHLTRELSYKLAMVFDKDVDYWLELDHLYRSSLEAQQPFEWTDEEEYIATTMPYTDLVKCHCVLPTRKIGEKIANLRRFFAVNHLEDLPLVNRVYQRVHIQRENNFALLAWIRMAEIAAHEITVKKFSKKKLLLSISRFRALTTLPFSEFYPELQKMCADCGIALVVATPLKGIGVNGVTFQNS